MRLLALCSLLLLGGTALANDVPGSRDPEALRRFERAEIVDFREAADQERVYPQGAVNRLSGRTRYEGEVPAQGQQTAVTYAIPKPHSAMDAFNQARESLQEQGAHVLYWCEGRECGSSNLWANAVFGNARLYGSDDQQAYALLRLAPPRAETLLALYAITRGNRRAYLHVEQLDASVPLGTLLPRPATLLRQLRSSGELDLPLLQGEPTPEWSQLLARSLNQDSTLRVMLSGIHAQQWREQLVEQGVRAARLELDTQATEGLRLDRVR